MRRGVGGGGGPVGGVDFRFRERMRGVVEYMQYREMPADIKRRVRWGEMGVRTFAGGGSLGWLAGWLVGLYTVQAQGGVGG